MTKERIKWIDTLKGFAILLVVIGHVADGYLNAGLYNQYNKVMSISYGVIYSFHMSLFFAISGYLFYKVYYKDNILKKDRFLNQVFNLICVYFIFSILQWCFKMVFSGNVNVPFTVNDLLLMPFKPMAPYWYLHVLIALYCISNYILKFKAAYYIKILVLFIISIIIKLINIDISMFSVSNILYYCLFFYMGICLAKEKKFFSALIKPINAVLCFMVWSGLLYLNNISGTESIMAFTACVFIIFIFFKFKFLQESKILNLFGKYCLEIYVLHCFFTSGNRVILPKIGITNFYLNVIVNIVISISIPIIFSMILRKINIQELFFRPMNFIKRYYT